MILFFVLNESVGKRLLAIKSSFESNLYDCGISSSVLVLFILLLNNCTLGSQELPLKSTDESERTIFRPHVIITYQRYSA